MSKKLPNIYRAPISKRIKNNDQVFYSAMDSQRVIPQGESKKDVRSEIDALFQEEGYLFNKNVVIKTKESSYDTALVSRNANGVITLDNDYILYDDIISFQRKNR